MISGARQEMFNNTVSGGLSVTGGKKQGWANKDSTARNGMHIRDKNLSIQDIVDNVLKK